MKHAAIIHLRERPLPMQRLAIEPMLRAVRGVNEVDVVTAESLIAVGFDPAQTTLAEIVRVIEDCGPSVAGVAQRRTFSRMAG